MTVFWALWTDLMWEWIPCTYPGVIAYRQTVWGASRRTQPWNHGNR